VVVDSAELDGVGRAGRRLRGFVVYPALQGGGNRRACYGSGSQLLEDLLGVEKHERQAISERLHDGALQYVLLARQAMEDLREGSTVAADRVQLALVESSQLLRDVVRELHPDVLARLGLTAALTALIDGLTSGTELAVELDARTWPDGVRTDADYVLYTCGARDVDKRDQTCTGQHIWIDLEHNDGLGLVAGCR